MRVMKAGENHLTLKVYYPSLPPYQGFGPFVRSDVNKPSATHG
ncbi:MAG TPA: hypothetical protein VG324_11795 [Blastocatellia bacterium]|nr:hypothetical protein [Blastocatellia bacterium]